MRNWKLYVGAFVAGCVLFAAAVSNAKAQKVVRLGRSSAPASNTPETAAGGGTQKVQPVEPTPEQAEKIEKLIAQLGAPTLRERDRAMSELAEFGASAIKQVQAAIDDDDDEIGHRCTILLEVLYTGKAELFLAARRLGMTDKELEVKLAAADPTELLATLEQNSGAGMAPIWARVLASLSPVPQRYPAALACRRAEGLDGYGAVLVKAARDAETRRNPQRAYGLVSLACVLPPQNAQDAVLALAALTGMESQDQRLQAADFILRSAASLRGVYDAQACLASLSEENDKLLTFKDAKGERLLAAVAMALAPAVSEAQLGGARLPPLASMNQFELREYCALCARSSLHAALEKALVSAMGAGMEERRLALIAHGLAGCGEVSFRTFDALPLAARLAMLDAWWFAPPPAAKLQPFLIARLASKEAPVRAACAALLGGYRAPSTALALAQCALTFADSAPNALAALAPMADLLAPQTLKALTALLDSADLRTRPALLDVLLSSADNAATQALKARWKAGLPMNELWRAVQLYAREPQTAAGAWAASQLVMAAQSGSSDTYFLRFNLQQSDLLLLRWLLARDDAAGFALLRSLAGDPFAPGSADALLALACAGQDGELAPDIAKAHAAGTDPRGQWLALCLALSATPTGEEFRAQALKQKMDKPDLPALVTAVACGRGGKVTREAVLEALAATPGNLFLRGSVTRLLMRGALPEKAAHALATSMLFDGDAGAPFVEWAPTMMLRYSSVDVLDVLFGQQEAPVARTPLQISACAVLGKAPRAAEIIARIEAAKDGSNFELREGARAWLGLTQGPQANAALDSQLSWRVYLQLRKAENGDAAALRDVFDRYGPDAGRLMPEGYASVIAGSRYRGDGNAETGAAFAAYTAPALSDNQPVFAPMVEKLLGVGFSGEFATWWACRRGLFEYDAAKKSFVLVDLK